MVNLIPELSHLCIIFNTEVREAQNELCSKIQFLIETRQKVGSSHHWYEEMWALLTCQEELCRTAA